MARTFKPIWGERGRRPVSAAAASGAADSESGQGANGRRQALRALAIMLERGLVDRGTYEARRAEILAGRIAPED